MRFSETIKNVESWRSFFLWVCFFCVPFSIAGGEFANAGFYITTIILFVTKKEKWEKTPIFYGWVLFFIGVILSTIFSDEIQTSLGYYPKLWRFLLPFLFCFALSKRNLRPYFHVILFSATVIGIYAIIQHFTGIDFLRSAKLQKEYLPNGKGSWNSLGIFSHHLTFGGIFLLIFPIFLSASFSDQFSKKMRSLYFFSGIIIFLASFFSMGRSIWLGSIITFVVLLILWKPKLGLLAFVIGILLFSGLYTQKDQLLKIPVIKSSPIGKRLHSALQTSSNKDRLYMWLAGWRTVKENLIFGVGPRMNKKMKPHYEKIAKDKKHRFEHQPSTGVHNIYLQNWVNFGIFGLLGYLLWWGSLLYKGISISFIKKVSSEKLENQTFLRGILSGFVGILIAGFFENNFRDGEVQIAIFLLMGTAMALIKKIEE